MLDRLTLKFGQSPGSKPLQLTPGSMTVLVGPNNSGKSLTLREIQDFIVNSKARKDILLWDSYFRVVDSVCPQLPHRGELRDAILQEIRKDIEPFRGALAAAKLSPRELIEKFDLAHIKPIFGQLAQLGQLRRLAEQRKIDPALIDFDWHTAKEQPTLLQAAAALLKEAISFIERNERILARVGAKADNAMEDDVVASGAIRLEGYLHHFAEKTILLDGRTRLSLTDPADTHSLHEPAQNVIMRLFHSERDLNELRKYVFDAFRRHLAIDLTALVSGRFVLSDEHPGTREKAIGTDEARMYFKGADDIKSLSDGLKSYVGLHATLLSQDYRIVLLDEPEAFLHPPLARRLGSNLTKLAAKRGATVLAATHSPFFLMGCLEAGTTTTVVRLGYHDRTATARHLYADALHRVMNDPLLRSSRVLDALFHQSAVVCEGDSDQAFYDEVNERLRRDHEHEGGNGTEKYARDCLFINSHGKDSIARLMGMLRTMGIPAAGVVDLDVLQDAGAVANRLLAQLLAQAGAGEAVLNAVGPMRSKIRNHFEVRARAKLESEGKGADADKLKTRTEKLIKRGGIDNLIESKERADLEEFIHLLKRHGIFTPPRGEVETWLAKLGKADVDKKKWLGEIFAAMGSLETPDSYLRPEEGDVWDFVRGIAEWIDNHYFSVPSSEPDDPLPQGVVAAEAAIPSEGAK